MTSAKHGVNTPPGRGARLAALLARGKRSRLARALRRFNDVGGSVLCGGIAYAALFSIFAGLTIAYTLAALVLRGRPDLLNAVLESVDDVLPGLIDVGNGGAIHPDQLLLSSALSWTSVIAVLVLLWSAISFTASLRKGVRAVFDKLDVKQRFVLVKARELGGFLVLVVAVVLSATFNVLASRFGSWLAGLVHLEAGAGLIASGIGFALAGIVDVLVVVFVVRVVGGVHPRRRDLWWGSVVVAVVLGVVQFLGTSVVAGAAHKNVLLASFAVVVTLLAVVNFGARVLLLVCAWVADPPSPSREGEPDGEGRAQSSEPVGDAGVAPEAPVAS